MKTTRQADDLDKLAPIDPTDQEVRLAAARTLIERDFRRRGLSLEHIARAANLSVYHFHRLFRRRYGRTPKQLVTALRVAEVQRLALGGLSLRAAADAVGFAHQSHMTTHFKRIVGLTPRQWLRTVGPTAAPADTATAGRNERRVRVRINLSLLRENLSNADGRRWTESEVDRWLRDAKFTGDGDGWIVREADLGQLEPEEVTSLEEVEREKP